MQPEAPLPRSYALARRVLEPVAAYHRHRVDGLEHVPRSGPVLGVVHHSLATYDALLLGMAIHAATGRVQAGLADDLIFATPGLAGLAWDAWLRPASHAHGVRLLRDGRFVWVAPGGMREALRPSAEARTVRWSKRTGFVRLALRTGAPVLLAACPAADRLYTVLPNPVTALAYRHLHVPVPVAFGWGGTWVPRPVQLTHRIAPLVHPPAYESEREDEQVADFHEELHARMSELLRD